ncbi:MAG: hypothetical protein JWQ18_1296, partial [Conexibacter sp.]|nr:hypothetical protein [Conexibacter sp.]
RRTLVLALIAAAIPVTVTATVVELSNDPPTEAPLPTLGAGPNGHVIDRDPLAAVPTEVAGAYGRLGAPATARDRDTQGTVHALAARSRQFGLSAGNARVMAVRDGYRIWLIPGNGYLCIGVQAIGDDTMTNGCATEATALRDGLNVSTTEQVFGILPDGVHQIEVADDGGARHVEPVLDNVYELAPISATVRYQVGATGSVSFRIVV